MAEETVTLREHLEMIMFMNDRRYGEVAIERERALRIREDAEKTALGLAREIQVYKDEKANELREQINSERGLYATKGDLNAAIEKVEATLKPLVEYVAADRGNTRGIDRLWGYVIGGIGMLIGISAFAFKFTGH